MIIVTRFNRTRFAVNPDLIERIQESPDTTIVLVGGASYVVLESMADVIELVARYRARVITLAHAMGDAGSPDISLGVATFPARLEVVEDEPASDGKRS
jgi:uncharacterized protein YlzI (FlbEa/FlbD family)